MLDVHPLSGYLGLPQHFLLSHRSECLLTLTCTGSALKTNCLTICSLGFQFPHFLISAKYFNHKIFHFGCLRQEFARSGQRVHKISPQKWCHEKKQVHCACVESDDAQEQSLWMLKSRVVYSEQSLAMPNNIGAPHQLGRTHRPARTDLDLREKDICEKI